MPLKLVEARFLLTLYVQKVHTWVLASCNLKDTRYLQSIFLIPQGNVFYLKYDRLFLSYWEQQSAHSVPILSPDRLKFTCATADPIKWRAAGTVYYANAFSPTSVTQTQRNLCVLCESLKRWNSECLLLSLLSYSHFKCRKFKISSGRKTAALAGRIPVQRHGTECAKRLILKYSTMAVSRRSVCKMMLRLLYAKERSSQYDGW
jgi:hypothetical protein